MKLLTKEIIDRAPAIGETSLKPNSEVLIIAKFFTPWAGWSWYMTEYDPDDNLAFGFVVGHVSELGYFSITELEELTIGSGAIGVERDLYFGEHTLAEVLNGARP